ncbi:MAG TPA: retropepsin-like aspartic protease [Solirubrobacterales bacterium]|nr:retropepsin-like aspartic protease [Solirubrobacterales bacterium]
MLPDSGASHSVFPKSFAEPLGIDLKTACETQKVDTGNGIAYHHHAVEPLKAEIAEKEIDLLPSFGKISVPVLGRKDFFAAFYVEINERRRVVAITPHD